MSKTLIKIYLLIMLECRLSLEDASIIFNIDRESLKEYFASTPLNLEYQAGLDYLYFETSIYPEENKKGKLKAKLFLRRLQNILHLENKSEKIIKLNAFIEELAGPNITFAIAQRNYYSDEERKSILKYRLKYAVPKQDMHDSYNIHNETLLAWEDKLPECELKRRLSILKSYLAGKKTIPSK